jgi:ligand-binding sensor domain-containing protein
LGLAIPATPWESFLTSNSPIIDNTINALAFTADAKLWIGTPKGLSRYELPIGGR